MPNNPTINYPFILFLIQSTMELVKKTNNKASLGDKLNKQTKKNLG
jgi:hypothetical protein